MKKFTFKTVKPTGKWKSFESDDHLIKLDGKEVGKISDGTWVTYNKFKISFMVEKDVSVHDPNPRCSWKWVGLKGEHESLLEAKEWLNKNFDKILDKLNLHKSE